MKVKKLIKQLLNVPMDAEVIVSDWQGVEVFVESLEYHDNDGNGLVDLNLVQKDAE